MAEYVLYQRPPLGTQESSSPCCVKVRRVLRYHQVPFRSRHVESATEVAHLSPAGQVPVLVHEHGAVWDSSRICRWVEERHPDRPLIPRENLRRAQMTVLEDWADESLCWYLLDFRWRPEENWRRTREALFRPARSPLRWLAAAQARRRVLARLDAQGIGRRPQSGVIHDFEMLLDALERAVHEGFLVGEDISLADVAVAAPLWGMRSVLTPRAAETIRRRRRLDQWLDRVDDLTGGGGSS